MNIQQTAWSVKNKTSERPPTQRYIATVEQVRPFDHGIMPWKFSDVISNGSHAIVLTDRQTHKQTDTAENNTTLAVRVVIMSTRWNEEYSTNNEALNHAQYNLTRLTMANKNKIFDFRLSSKFFRS